MRLSAKSSVRVPETVSMRGRHRPKQGEATHYFELWDVRTRTGVLGRPSRCAPSRRGTLPIGSKRSTLACGD